MADCLQLHHTGNIKSSGFSVTAQGNTKRFPTSLKVNCSPSFINRSLLKDVFDYVGSNSSFGLSWIIFNYFLQVGSFWSLCAKVVQTPPNVAVTQLTLLSDSLRGWWGHSLRGWWGHSLGGWWGHKLGQQSFTLVRKLCPCKDTHCTQARKSSLVPGRRQGRDKLTVVCSCKCV